MNGQAGVSLENDEGVGKIEYGRKGPSRRAGSTPTPPVVCPEISAADLESHEGARQQLAKIIEARSRGAIDGSTFQALVWSLQVLLPSLRAEKWAAIEKRLEQLERGGITE